MPDRDPPARATLTLGPETLRDAPETLTRDELLAATSVVASALMHARQQLATARAAHDDATAEFWRTQAARLERAHAWLFKQFDAAPHEGGAR